MTYEERKAWLRRYQDALDDYRMATARMEEANTQATKCTASVSSYLGHGGTSDHIPAAVERIEAIREDANQAMAEAKAALIEISAALKKLESRTERTVLAMRYVDGYTWQQVADKCGYSIDWVYALHRSAIKNLDK